MSRQVSVACRVSTDGGATWIILRGLHDLGNASGVSIDIGDQ